MHFSLLGRKKGMTHIFDEKGRFVPCTVVEICDSFVARKKDMDKDGYVALQMATGKVLVNDERTMAKRVSKPVVGFFKKSGVEVCREIYENRLSYSESDVEFRDRIGLEIFSEVAFVDVKGISKGKGFQGVMKRFGFRGGPASHGSGFHRHGGSTGMRSTPGRCFPGGKKPGRMGGGGVTVKNLKIVKVDIERNVLFIQGGVPGVKDAWLSVCCSYDSVKQKLLKS